MLNMPSGRSAGLGVSAMKGLVVVWRAKLRLKLSTKISCSQIASDFCYRGQWRALKMIVARQVGHPPWEYMRDDAAASPVGSLTGADHRTRRL
jgi:hypothetical protein